MQTLIRKILTARVYDVAIESPLDSMGRLSTRLDNHILLKREDLQPVFSFKLRGAFNKIASLSQAALERGIICASAGNHAQGVALAARHRGVRAVIVMPTTTPPIKVQSVMGFGGEVVLHGDAFDEAYLHARSLEQQQGLTFIHPYDDIDVIAGQGTIGVELLRQHPDPIHAVFIAVGGGGLISGVSAYIKFLRPEVKIIGVEPQDAASLHAALEAQQRVALDQVGIFADGVAVKQIGEEPFRITQETVDHTIQVSTDEICAAIKDIFDDTRSIAEPAGALGVAGLKKYVAQEGIRDANLIAINCGANINFDRLRHVAERAEYGEQREALLAVNIPEEPGSFRRFCETIGKRSITEFNYRYAGNTQEATIFAGIELRQGAGEKEHIITSLEARDFRVMDMTDDELAKLHIRHMVGGRSPELGDEVLYRFQFPERPGALLRFLEGIGPWNISLFHYRNHGSAHGRVLAGIQVPESARMDFEKDLDQLGYPYWNESANPAYRLFLGDNHL